MSRRLAPVVEITTARRRLGPPTRRRPATRATRPALWPTVAPAFAGAELVDDQVLDADPTVVDIQTAHRRRRRSWPAGHRSTIGYLVTATTPAKLDLDRTWRTYETTGPDLAAVLRAFANAHRPMDWLAAFAKINPIAGVPTDGRRRENKAWSNRQNCLYRVMSDAHRWGFLVEAVRADPDEPTRSSITQAGLDWLNPNTAS